MWSIWPQTAADRSKETPCSLVGHLIVSHFVVAVVVAVVVVILKMVLKLGGNRKWFDVSMHCLNAVTNYKGITSLI